MSRPSYAELADMLRRLAEYRKAFGSMRPACVMCEWNDGMHAHTCDLGALVKSLDELPPSPPPPALYLGNGQPDTSGAPRCFATSPSGVDENGRRLTCVRRHGHDGHHLHALTAKTDLLAWRS